MTNLARYAAKVFGSTAGSNQMAKYGSLIAAPPGNLYDGSTITPDIVQELSNYSDGLYAATGGAYSPTIQDQNSLFYLMSYQIAYLLEKGIPEWNSDTTYYSNDYVRSGSQLYYSLTDSNLNNAVTDNTKWAYPSLYLNSTYINNGTAIAFYNANNVHYASLSASAATSDASYSLPPGYPTISNQALVSSTLGAMNWGDNISIPNNGVIKLFNASNVHFTSLSGSATTADTNYILPPTFPSVSGEVLSSDTSGNMTWFNILSTFIAPTIQKFTSGSGTYTLPTSPRAPLYIRVKMAGGGGGGSGSGASAFPIGGDGTDSTFGSGLTAGHGTGAKAGGSGAPGAGGSATFSVGIGIAIQGQDGTPGTDITTSLAVGGSGGQNFFAGAGNGGSPVANLSGTNAIANTGGGGGGAGIDFDDGDFTGWGGGAGGYLDVMISSPSSTYAYSVGTGGAGGTTSAVHTGGNGAAGIIIVEEYYQ